jgi:hypothetical protein
VSELNETADWQLTPMFPFSGCISNVPVFSSKLKNPAPVNPKEVTSPFYSAVKNV